jgi:hypothetical protein
MDKTVRKIFFIWQYKKEEQWLNEMSNQGLQLKKADVGKYKFSRGNKGEYSYRLELLEKDLKSEESTSYMNFLKDTGIEFVSECSRWVYLRRKTADGGFGQVNNSMYDLTHTHKLQEFMSSIKNKLAIVVLISIVAILVLENLTVSDPVDFLKGVFAGLTLASSGITVILIPFSILINNKTKMAIKELYACE